MAEQLQYFNSEQAAKILGVNVSTIKRWTDEGKLQCVKSAGGHRKFLFYHLAGFIEKHNLKKAKASLFPLDDITDLQISQYILAGDFEYLRNFVLDMAYNCNRKRVLQVMQGLYMSQMPLHEIYDNLIVPVLYRIGQMWEEKRISVSEEHIASQTMRDSLVRLQALINLPSNSKGNVLCLNFSDELHDIGLKMTDHILETKGYRVLFSGQLTPHLQLEQLFKSFQPQKVFISCTVIQNLFKTQEELDYICELCNRYESELYLGGRAVAQLNLTNPAITGQLQTFKDLNHSLTDKDLK